jgi:hypothetical protein
MLRVSASVELSASVERVWSHVSRFDDASWVRGTKQCLVEGAGVGAVRTIVTVDGARIREKLLSYDETAHRFSYAIIEAPMPLHDYVSSVEVEAKGSGTRMTWSCSFEAPAENAEAIRTGLDGLFRASLEDLKTSLG